jgi:hypothetical protein
VARPRSKCTSNYRPILSPERVLHIKKLAIVREIKNLASPTPRQSGLLTVGRKLTSTSTSVAESLLVQLGCCSVIGDSDSVKP